MEFPKFFSRLAVQRGGVDRQGLEDLPLLSLIGAVVGILVALVVIAFRAAIQWGSQLILGIEEDKFEQLSSLFHAGLPVAGALIVIALLPLLPSNRRQVGVVHVIERFQSNDVKMPVRNSVFQFLAGSLALIFGTSGGREGPAIHLGAATGSHIAHALRLPHNNIRVLVACGIAASIAASFDLPIASIVFTMEVIMMEYTITAFLPIMVSAFTATTLLHLLVRQQPLYDASSYVIANQWEFLYIFGMGIAIGIVASLFKQLIKFFANVSIGYHWLRILAAGLFTGALAWFLPEVLGMGWDTTRSLLEDPYSMSAAILLALVGARLLATSASAGLGLPVGIIGPTLVIGVMLGVLFGTAPVLSGAVSDSSIYGLLGAVAMFAATLNAPLAALLSVVELSNNHLAILPGLLVVVASTLTTYLLNGQRSVFVERIHAMGIPYPPPPYVQFLRRNSIRAAMNYNISVVEDDADSLKQIDSDEELTWRVRPQSDETAVIYSTSQLPDATGISVPILSSRSSLEEALTKMDESEVDAVCATEHEWSKTIIGVLERRDIDRLDMRQPDEQSN